MSQQFHLARWVVALFAVGVIGGSVITILGVADFLTEYDADPGGTMLRIVLVGGGILVLIVLPGGYYLIRRTRGIPVLTIDARGVVLGGNWEEDLAVEWANVSRIVLRRASANGINDVHAIFHLADEAPLKRRARNRRQKASLWFNRFMFGAPFGLSTAYVSGGSEAVLRALARHYPGELKAEGPR